MSTMYSISTFILGCIIHYYALHSLQPAIFASLLGIAGISILLIPFPLAANSISIRFFLCTFGTCWMTAGVAAIYATVSGDPSQLVGDAESFFLQAAGDAAGLSLEDLKIRHEGSLAIVLWSVVYDWAEQIGFSRERYIGIAFNVFVVSLASVVMLGMANLTYGEDSYRAARLRLLYISCGLIWLFASVHLRDSVVLLGVACLAYCWLLFLSKPASDIRLLVVLAASLAGAFVLGLLRQEFVFVPLGMAAAGITALLLSHNKSRNSGKLVMLLLVGLVSTAGILAWQIEVIEVMLAGGNEGYLNAALDQHSSDSLGVALIVKQPILVRLVAGSLYLCVFPIPVWSGFQAESVYRLFKSCNAIFFYFVIPILCLSVWSIYRVRDHRTAQLLFLLFCLLGFTAAIAGTSLETRHFGAFLFAVFVLSLLPDLRLADVRRAYKRLLFGVLMGIGLVHVAWVVIKFT